MNVTFNNTKNRLEKTMRLHPNGQMVVESKDWWQTSWQPRKFFADNTLDDFRAAWSYMVTLEDREPVYDASYWEIAGDILEVVNGTPH